jgi:Holliday junction resolvase RusA-like endonuclease
MLPFEFTVLGPPVSHQSRNKTKLAAWRALVRAEAEKRWGAADPLSTELKVTVTFYHEGPAVRIDNDNMLKPIQDALIGLVYDDDRLVTDTVVRKTSIDGSFRVRGCSMLLLRALAQGDQFIHVLVDEAPNHDELLK